MLNLEDRVLLLAKAFYGSNVVVQESEGSVQALFIDEETPNGYVTKMAYFGDIKMSLAKSTKKERLQQAEQILKIKIHNKITELKGAIAQCLVLESEECL